MVPTEYGAHQACMMKYKVGVAYIDLLLHVLAT